MMNSIKSRVFGGLALVVAAGLAIGAAVAPSQDEQDGAAAARSIRSWCFSSITGLMS